jgi:uncharacterized protein with FMN-binding domain
MKRIATWFLSTVTLVVLMFGYHTSTASTVASPSNVISGSAPSTTSQAAGSGSGGGNGNGGGGDGNANAGTANGSGSNAASTPSTATGGVAQTQWGPVQVQLSLDGGTITKVSVLQYPTGNNTDAQINGYALPILIDETLQAQSAQIDMVSGATVTSTGYTQSLQSALDQAGL